RDGQLGGNRRRVGRVLAAAEDERLELDLDRSVELLARPQPEVAEVERGHRSTVPRRYAAMRWSSARRGTRRTSSTRASCARMYSGSDSAVDVLAGERPAEGDGDRRVDVRVRRDERRRRVADEPAVGREREQRPEEDEERERR